MLGLARPVLSEEVPACSFLRCRASHAYTLCLHPKQHKRNLVSCGGCAGCTCWHLASAMQSSLLSTSHVHTSVSLAVRLLCQTFMLTA